MIFIILQIDSLHYTLDKNKNEEDDSQKDTSKNVCTNSDCEKRVLIQTEPEPLAESKEEIPKIEREDELALQPSDGKFTPISIVQIIPMCLDT